MKLLLAIALVLVVLFAADADACARRRRRKGGQNGRIVVTPRNPPLLIPPTPNPTPPPPPPPIPQGWVPPPPRPPAQEMTRTNCKARVEFTVLQDANSATSDVVDRSQIQEQWIYTCTFQVYVEVDIAETEAPTNCACGVVHQRQHQPHDPNYAEQSYSTEITAFAMVAFDVVRNVVTGNFPADTFDQLKLSANATAMLKNQAASNSQNYELTAAGYAGLVKNLGSDKFPAALIENSPMWTPNNVPAMCFTVEERYISSYKWPQPPFPTMYTTPNVWVSQCYPFYDYDGVLSAKRDAASAENQRYWFKDFLLFPMGSDSVASGAGWKPSSRYITSYYTNSNCQQAAGVVSFDREFTYTMERESRMGIHGAFAWTRTYSDVWVVGGVPKSFSNSLAFYRNGFTQVAWNEVFGTDSTTGAYRQRVVYHALLGTPEVNGQPFIGAGAHLKLCTKVPAAWETCLPGQTAGCADLRTATYNEKAHFFKAPPAGSLELDCGVALRQCADETVLLSFQNFGSLARDYSKRRDSVLLTSPRTEFCKPYPLVQAFDTLYFRPYKAGEMQIRKRAVAQQGDEVTMQLAFRHDGNVDTTPASTDVPRAADVLMKPAAGSADQYGNPGGDHPVGLFPETYTVPITLNPADSSYDGVSGSIFDGTAAPCLEGSRGCTCRTNVNRVACDAPLVCSESNFCEPPACIAGQAGCACEADGSCADATLSCSAGNMCVFEQSCTAGANGCVCAANDACTDVDAECTADKVCLVTKGECTDGTSGCTCASEGAACADAADVCDEVGNVCVSPTCESGQPGCECVDERCRAGFECVSGACVQSTCPEGQAGCACKAGDVCDAEGFECRKFKTDGSDNRCVAKGKECGDQTERCVKFCGVGKVLRCPACSNMRPQCAGASALVPSALAALALALVALLF